jgi:uncharacterized protein (TIGR02588 family)
MTTPVKNWVEWAVFGLGLLTLAVVVGYLAYDMITSDGTPGQLTVRLGAPAPAAGQYMVPVTVENRGDTSVENVYVEVVLTGAGAEAVRAMVELAFVPRGSEAQGWVVFPQDPAGGRMEARVLGYEEP